MQVSAFWMGACAVARKRSLNAWVDDTGGWEAVQAGGPDVWRRGGLSEAEIRLWRAGRPATTGVVALTRTDARYPAALASLPDAPPVLFVEGALEALRMRGLAVVGTRGATPYGLQIAREMGGLAAAAGLCVVSGLARGIDAAAHTGAVGRGTTLAVLGHGVGHTAPASHRSLRRRILAAGGALVTTHLDDEPPRPWTFPVRNRWIAGLSAGVVVVEAPSNSGALHTVRAAADYGREVFAVPGPIGVGNHEGTNRLLADGATPVLSVRELVDRVAEREPSAVSWLDDLVGGTPLVDVARQRGMALAALLDELDMMEATGELVRLPGQRYARGV